MKNRYQTSTQVLLDILLGKVSDEIALSGQRITKLREMGDMEVCNGEIDFNEKLIEELEIVQCLKNMHAGEYSTSSTTVEIYDDWYGDFYTSKELRQENAE